MDQPDATAILVATLPAKKLDYSYHMHFQMYYQIDIYDYRKVTAFHQGCTFFHTSLHLMLC